MQNETELRALLRGKPSWVAAIGSPVAIRSCRRVVASGVRVAAPATR